MNIERATSMHSANGPITRLTAFAVTAALALTLTACGPEPAQGDGGGRGLNVPNGSKTAGSNGKNDPAATRGGNPQRPADAKLAIALESLRSPKALDRELALSGIAPAAMAKRDAKFVVPALTWLLSNPKATLANRAKAGALLALYRDQAASAAPYAIEALDEPKLAWSALRILAGVGDAAKPASAKVLAILRDDQATVKKRKLAIDILRVTETENPTFKSILRVMQKEGPETLRKAASAALGN